MAESAQKWTSYASPQPYSNLSAGVLPTLCSYILGDLGDDGKTYPRTCANEFGYGYDTHDIDAYNRQVYTGIVALTGYNDTILDTTACTLHGEGRNFRSLTPSFSNESGAYDAYTREVTPVMAVWFSVANVERMSSTSWADSTMTCVRAKDFSEGSRVSPALPMGTPYDYRKGLSSGAIAGIVVGVVGLVAVIAGIGFWLWRRRAKMRSQARDNAKVVKAKEIGLSEFGGDDFHELKSEDRKLEKDSSPINEMDGGDRAAELQAGSRFVELTEETKPAELSA